MRPARAFRGQGGFAQDFPSQEAVARFDTSTAVTVANADDLAALSPGFLRSLGADLGVQVLGGRLCPALLADQSVAIFSLAEHVGGDQADELARRISRRGHRLASPQRYILPAPLLLAVVRGQVTAQPPLNRRGSSPAQSRTELADVFLDLVEWGVRHHASDLHLNVRLREPESEVRYTIAGRYVAPERFRRMPTDILVDMLCVAWMDISGGNGAVFDPLIEQQGKMVREVGGATILLRWASLAADQGPSVCVRLLRRDAEGAYPALAQLGYLPGQVRAIERVMLSEGGAIVFSGTVGSGKSTTLASLMSSLPDWRKIITLEDPVEYLIPRAVQNTVTRELNISGHDAFAAKLRTLKRSAMSDVLLGEIRDRETGRAFMDLTGSGVNVYTTVHAPSAALVGERLASDFIGISRDFLTTPGMLKLLVHQALLPRLCPHCSLAATDLLKGGADATGRHRPGSDWREWLGRLQRLHGSGAVDSLRIRNASGCGACFNEQVPDLTGYAGRTVAAELIEPELETSPRHDARMAGGGVQACRARGDCDSGGCEAGPRTAMDCAFQKALRGEIDPRDIESRFQAFETVELRRRARLGSTSAAAP